MPTNRRRGLPPDLGSGERKVSARKLPEVLPALLSGLVLVNDREFIRRAGVEAGQRDPVLVSRIVAEAYAVELVCMSASLRSKGTYATHHTS